MHTLLRTYVESGENDAGDDENNGVVMEKPRRRGEQYHGLL